MIEHQERMAIAAGETKTRNPVRNWGGEPRPLRERVHDYDWDGLIEPACATLSALLEPADRRRIADDLSAFTGAAHR